MKKHKLSSFLLGAAFLVLTSTVFSIPKNPCDKVEVCCEEPAPGPFAFYYPQDKGLSCPNDFYLKGEYLLVQVKEDGLEYAMTQEYWRTTGANRRNVFPVIGGDIKGYSTDQHNWDWTSGCRVGMGFYLNHDSWNIDAKWTYIRINNDSGTVVSSGVLLPLWMGPYITLNLVDGNDSCVDTSARWTGDLNTLDLSLGKPYNISRNVTFNTYFGIRMAWIERDFLVRNGGNFTDAAASQTASNIDALAKNDFWGVGPRVGIDTSWGLGGECYLFGNASTSILFSHFDIHQSMTIGNQTIHQLKHDFYTNSPNAELTLGLGWSHFFCKNKYLLSLKAAYEMHYWWNQNHFRRFLEIPSPISNDETAKNDLKVNGFSFAVQFDF